jgi:hypothetical protein
MSAINLSKIPPEQVSRPALPMHELYAPFELHSGGNLGHFRDSTLLRCL